MASLNYDIPDNEDYTCTQADLDAFAEQVIDATMRDATCAKANVPAFCKDWTLTYGNEGDRTETQTALVTSKDNKKLRFNLMCNSIAPSVANCRHWDHLPKVRSQNARVQELAKRVWGSSTEHNQRQKLCEMLYTAIILLHHFKNTIEAWESITFNDAVTKGTNRTRTINKLVNNMVAYIPLQIAMGGEQLKEGQVCLQNLDINGSPYYHFVVQPVIEHAMRIFHRHTFDLNALHAMKAKNIFATYNSKVKANGIFDLATLRRLNTASNPNVPQWVSGLPYPIWDIFKILNKQARIAKLNPCSLQGLDNNGLLMGTALRANSITISFPGHPTDYQFTLKGECLYGSGHNDSIELGDADMWM